MSISGEADLLVERDALIGALGDGVDRASRGEGSVVFVGGEAGVGKTSLVRMVAARPGPGVEVWWGACDPLATPRPLGPLVDIAARSRAVADLLAHDGSRHDVFSGVLSELAADTHLVVFEDVHWADEATLDLLRFLGRRATRTRSVVVATFRDDEVDAAHPLRSVTGDLATAPGHHRLTVERLSVAGVRTLAADSPMDAEHLHHVTGGNPFYVTEVLAAPAWTVPPTVTDAVLARAQRLPAPARALLALVSAEPARLEVSIVDALGHTGEAVAQAVTAGMLIDTDDALSYRHELARLAVAESLTPARRRGIHADLLATLQDIPGIDPARMSHHATHAHDPPAILDWSRAAARVAAAVGANRQVADQYERALAHLDLLDATERISLLRRYALALLLIDRTADSLAVCRQLVDLAQQTGTPVEVAAARTHLAQSLWVTGEVKAALDLMTEIIAALEPLPAGPALAEAYATAGWLAMMDRRGHDALRWSGLALYMGDQTQPRALGWALIALGCTKILSFQDLSGMDDLDRCLEISAAAGHDGFRPMTLMNAGGSLGEIRRYTEAVAYLEEGIAYCAERDLDSLWRPCTSWLARIRFEQGSWDEATALIEDWVVRDDVSPMTHIAALTALGRIGARRGDPGADDAVAKLWQRASPTEVIQNIWPAVVARAELFWLAADGSPPDPRLDDDLAAALDQAATLDLAWGIGELAFWSQILGHAVPDDIWARAADPFRLHASGHHHDAARAWASLGCPYEEAWALLDAGDEPSLRQALDTFTDLGAGPMVDRARHALRTLGADAIPVGPRATTRAHPAGLTTRQAEVLTLLTQGLTDRQIARTLSISPKTAGHHVTAILAKLEVTSRTEAAARAHQEGWTEPGSP